MMKGVHKLLYFYCQFSNFQELDSITFRGFTGLFTMSSKKYLRNDLGVVLRCPEHDGVVAPGLGGCDGLNLRQSCLVNDGRVCEDKMILYNHIISNT